MARSKGKYMTKADTVTIQIPFPVTFKYVREPQKKQEKTKNKKKENNNNNKRDLLTFPSSLSMLPTSARPSLHVLSPMRQHILKRRRHPLNPDKLSAAEKFQVFKYFDDKMVLLLLDNVAFLGKLWRGSFRITGGSALATLGPPTAH